MVTRRIGFLFIALLCAVFCLPARGAQSVSLRWDTSTDPNVTGYYLYFGTNSTNLSSRVDVGTNTTATITGLTGKSVNYYFTATAYNQQRTESVPSNQAQFLTSSNTGPSLASVPGLAVNVSTLVVVTNTATSPDVPAKQLTFSLDPGAPPNMRLDPATGKVMWLPRLDFGGTTNYITVRVTDNSAASLYDVKSFTIIVSNGVEVSLGSTVVALGQTNSIPVTLVSSGPVTNVSFILDAPSNRVSNVTLQSLLPGVASVSQQSPGALHSTVTISALPGQSLQGTQVVAQINFLATIGRPSAFAPFAVSSVGSVLANGQPVPKKFCNGGEAALIGAESIAKNIVQTNGRRDFVIYGPAGKTFQLESCNYATGTNVWASVLTTGVMGSSLYQTFTNFAPAGGPKYYRIRGL